MNYLKIKKNRYGAGVYATKSFKKGDLVWTMNGKEDKLPNFKFKSFKSISNLLQVSKSNYMILDKISCAFNHSCNPNIGFKNSKTLIAVKNINKGQELAYDYSTTMDESFVCDCGFKKCRKVVADFFSLPKDTMKNYYNRKMLPDFIKNKYEKLFLKTK